jgi:hypothetical protein
VAVPAATLTKSSTDKAFVTTFTKDPAPVFLSVIEQSDTPLRAADIKAAVAERGVQPSVVDKKWEQARPLIKIHPRVRADKLRYGWRSEPVAADEALAALVEKPARPLPQWLRDALGAVITAALESAAVSGGNSTTAEPTAAEPATAGADPAIRAAQERQWRIDVVRAVAELAMEAEEIAFKGADAELILERVQTRAALHSLQPIGQAGAQVAFDPAQHEPLAGDPAVGSAVFVVRPGYTWHARNEDVLIERAVVSTT